MVLIAVTARPIKLFTVIRSALRRGVGCVRCEDDSQSFSAISMLVYVYGVDIICVLFRY